MEEELILTGILMGVTFWSYILAFFSTYINIALGFHRRNTFLLDILVKHDFKKKRIIIMHGFIVLLYLIVLLIYQFINNITWSIFGIFFIAYSIVLFYTMTAISISIYRRKMEEEKKWKMKKAKYV
ncbi:MAG: hypothetical protein ACMUHM_01335 [Thermoplasmatota archaeon]